MRTRRKPDDPATPPAGGDERRDAQRRQLQSVADALRWSLEPRAVATRLIEAACTTLDSPQGWVAVRSEDGRSVELLAWRGFEDEAIDPWRRVPLDMTVPMATVVRTGQAIIHASAAERMRDYPALAANGGAARHAEASAVVPMTFEGRTTGALAVTFPVARPIDGEDRWFLESLAAHGAGALERARLFEEVHERDERLRLALEASGTWIWEWDVDEDRMRWTPSPPGTLPGRDGENGDPDAWIATIDPEDLPALQDAISTSMATGEPYEVEFRVHAADGRTRWFQATGRRSADAEGAPARIVGAARDVTERKLAELEGNRRLEAEREATRLREAFIGVVSHELRTPITTIFGGTRVLSRRWRHMPPAARDALLGDVSSEADRLFRLVEDLLVLTRVERGSLDVGDEPVGLRPVLERVLASERARAPEVTFEARVPPDLPSVEGEDTYAEQVLRNLLGNAAKYGGPGSRVKVEASANGDDVVVRVLDEGPGFREDEAEQLFELFYRSPDTAPTVAGAGIGLFVCRQLALAMGGTIRAERRAGGGAAFILTLRRYADDGDA